MPRVTPLKPISCCSLLPCADMSLTLLSWTPRRASLVLNTAAEEHGKDGVHTMEEDALLPTPGSVGVAGEGGQLVPPAIMSLSKQLLKIQAPVEVHLSDFVVGAPEGAVLWPTLKQVGMVLVASLAYLQLGIAITWPNALAAHLPHDNSTLFNYHLHITHTGMDWVGSLMFLGTMVWMLPTGFLLEWLGRRLSMAVSCLPTALGWLLITFANNDLMIFAGRFFCGFGLVMMTSASKTYTAEISNTSFRGMAGTFLEIMKFFGHIGVAAAAINMAWYTIACINAVLVIMSGGLMLALPESPAFLAVRKKEAEARKALVLIRGPKADVDAELALLKLQNEQKVGNSDLKAFFRLEILKQVVALCVLFIMRDFSGSMVLMVHTTRMLQDTGVTLDPSLGTLILNSVCLCGIILLCIVVDRIGRRWSLMASFTFMAAGYTILGFYIYFFPSPPQLQPDLEVSMLSSLNGNATALSLPEASGDASVESRLFPFFCLMGILFANALGADSIPFLLPVEYFPTIMRTQGMCMCFLFAGVTSTISTQLYSTLVDNITLPGLFWTYALFATGGMLHTLFFIRETSRQNIG